MADGETEPLRTDSVESQSGLLVGGSVSFDRVADIYDATRALPADVAPKLTDALVAELTAADAGHVLEAGVGTGRIARPLAERGVRVCGVDIAPRMLGRLREQLGAQHVPPDLALADTTQLPIATDSFRVVLVFHLLHLVSSVEAAVAELRRVLAPGGVLIHGRSQFFGENPWDASIAKWNELMPSPAPVRRMPRPEEIESNLNDAGGSCRIVSFAISEERRTPAQNLDQIRRRIDSWSWEIPDDVFATCLARLEPWYRRHYGDMDRDIVQQVSYELEVWSFS